MLLSFPQFNIFSTPLLILVLQGLIFSILLLNRFRKSGQISDLLLALIILITCYHRTTYTIGFMGWYDTFRNTKINYFLIPLSLAGGPLIYFYVKSIITPSFKWNRVYYAHFIPVVVFFVYKVILYWVDAGNPGFDDTQNGQYKMLLDDPIVSPIYSLLLEGQFLLYIAFSISSYIKYRKVILDEFSETFRYELNWLRNFLIIYTLLFIYSVMESHIDSYIIELSYKQHWWYHFLTATAVLYLGFRGYTTPIQNLTGLDQKNNDLGEKKSDDYLNENHHRLLEVMRNQAPYLKQDLTLSQLAVVLNISRPQLSEVIHMKEGVNFNDFINKYRVEAVINELKLKKHKALSLMGIAENCGFNSKATFNRVFKKIIGITPTEYIKSQINEDPQ